MKTQSFSEKFSNLINAGFPYIYIPTYEEERAQAGIRQVLSRPELIKTPRIGYVWTQTEGLVRMAAVIDFTTAVPGTKDPMKALEVIEKLEKPGIFVFKDLHVFFGSERGTHPDFVLVRKLRDMLTHLKSSRKNIVFISPTLVIPSDMEKDISVLDFDLPTEEDISRLLDGLCQGLSPSQINLTPDERQTLVRAALGLTLQEAENSFCRAIVSMKGLNAKAIEIMHDEKNQVVRKTGMLEFVSSGLNIDDIGGLDNLKNWLVKRNNTWTDKARAYNLPAPKGVLITGVPGCGKSLTAKAMSAIWGLPLLKLDMGKIFGGIVGSSEENMRKAIATAEAVAPSILWVDEIEKGLSGIRSGGDSGTSARVFGTFLTWLQEKDKPVFVIATSNDISSIPPELLRKGRFDEIFFVDLPTTKEREKIFKVHIDKRIRDSAVPHEITSSPQVLARLAAATRDFTGSEIEQMVISALYEVFYKKRGLTEADIMKAISETVPLACTQAEQILRLREWAGKRAVLATAPEDREAPNESDPLSRDDRPQPQGGRIVNFDL